jgi:alkylation response protein AidB-like acyl-CoA dehydrogenase
VTRQRIAELHILEEVDRFAAQRQTDAVRTGDRPSSTGSLRKLARSALSRARSEIGMATLGADGMLVGADTPADGQIQLLALSAPSASIAGGTDEIQRSIVGERVLGFPKEPALDRAVPFRELKIGTRRDSASS